MVNKSYMDYISGPAWQRKRAEYWARYGRTCKVCGARQRLEVHHMTYVRFGNEDLTDLMGLCHTCHTEVKSFHRVTGGDLYYATLRYRYLKQHGRYKKRPTINNKRRTR